MTPRVAAALAGAAFALAACSQGGATHTNSATGQPETTITAADLPTVRAGYWERTDTSNNAPPVVSHFCDTGKIVDLTDVTKNCASFTLKRAGDGSVVVDASCASGTVATTMHMQVSGDYTTSYTSDAQVTIAMQGRPPQSLTSHSANRYIGACPPGGTADGATNSPA